MNKDAIKDSLREALRADAERFASNQPALALLFAGAEVAVAKRLGIVPDARLDDDDHEAYKRGWRVGSEIPLV